MVNSDGCFDQNALFTTDMVYKNLACIVSLSQSKHFHTDIDKCCHGNVCP